MPEKKITFPVNEVTPENRQAVLEALHECFDPSEVSFKPQVVDYKNKKAQAAAYADLRVYYKRLDDIVGPWNWTIELVDIVATPFTKLIRGRKAYRDNPATEDKLIPGNKVGMTARVHIIGLGTHMSSGEKDASDENAFTSAEAQAVKRAISKFGPGKYFYELGHFEYPYDPDSKKWTVEPRLPDKYLGKIHCDDCRSAVTGTTFMKGEEKIELTAAQVLDNGLKKYNARLCVECQKKRVKPAEAAKKPAAA